MASSIMLIIQLCLLIASLISIILLIKREKAMFKTFSIFCNLFAIAFSLDLMIQYHYINIFQFIIIVMLTFTLVVQLKNPA